MNAGADGATNAGAGGDAVHMVRPPLITDSARTLLAGRPVHLRSSPRHGCCGGTASVPVAEPGAPDTVDGVERFEVAGTDVFVDRVLLGGSWTIDTDGFSRWRRLVVLGGDVGVSAPTR